MKSKAQVICADCDYYRPPVPIALFTALDMANPEVQKVASEVETWERERAQREEHLASDKRIFSHQPRTKSWCQKYSAGVNKFFDPESLEMFGSTVRDGRTNEARALFAAQWERSEEQPPRRDPTTGDVIRLYVLTSYVNSDGLCPLSKSGRGDDAP